MYGLVARSRSSVVHGYGFPRRGDWAAVVEPGRFEFLDPAAALHEFPVQRAALEDLVASSSAGPSCLASADERWSSPRPAMSLKGVACCRLALAARPRWR